MSADREAVASQDVSIVVCARNCEALIRENLPQVRNAMPRAELIVVDGHSTDGTCAAAAPFADTIVSDEGNGLAYARQLGIDTATRPFVVFAGPDNQLSEKLIAAMRNALVAEELLAGLLIFRLLYYIVPFIVALVVLGVREFRLHFFGRRNGDRR